MALFFAAFAALAAARPAVLDVPLQDGGTGTVCGNTTCSYCCLEGYVCAAYLPDCAYISPTSDTDTDIFIVLASFFGVWVIVWFAQSIYQFIRNRKRRGY